MNILGAFGYLNAFAIHSLVDGCRDQDAKVHYCTISFNSARGGQGDRLAKICTLAILRVDRGHFPDFGQSKSSAVCASSSLRCQTDPQAVSDLAKAIDPKCHVIEFIPMLKRRKFNKKWGWVSI